MYLLASHQHLADERSIQCREQKQRCKLVQTSAERDLGGTEVLICPSWIMSHRCIINVTYTDLVSWEKLLYCWGMGIVPLTAFGFPLAVLGMITQSPDEPPVFLLQDCAANSSVFPKQF